MTEIKNREQIIAEFAEMLMQFDKDCNSYQTDVYMYIDDDGNASLDTFVNVGGNSWLDDDHYTIYTDKEHYDNYPIDYWCGDLGEICYSLGITEEQLRHDAAIELYDDVEEADGLEYWELEKYIDNNEDLRNKLFEEYCNFIDDNTADYEQRAEEIFDEFIAQQEEMERCESEQI